MIRLLTLGIATAAFMLVLPGSASAQSGGAGTNVCILCNDAQNARLFVERSACNQEANRMTIKVCFEIFNSFTDEWERQCCDSDTEVPCTSTADLAFDCPAEEPTHSATLDFNGHSHVSATCSQIGGISNGKGFTAANCEGE